MSPETMIGSLGVALLLLAFFLNLVRALPTESYPYTALNFAGASLAGYASYLIGFVPFVVLEGT
ncbi:MAG: CBU_0592 family membrane protein, partial [Candidatus Rokuibacteriota bacterium]